MKTFEIFEENLNIFEGNFNTFEANFGQRSGQSEIFKIWKKYFLILANGSTAMKIKMALNGEPSAIVSEILNNVSALSSVLNNSRNVASTSTTSNTSVEGEVRRIFRPGSVRNNQLTRQVGQDESRNQLNVVQSQMNQEMQTGISGNLSASVNAEAQRNVYSRSSTNCQLIRPNETIQTTNQVN